MAIKIREQLKRWFSRGQYPTEEQFADAFDSFVHKDDKIGIGAMSQEVIDTFNNKAEVAALAAEVAARQNDMRDMSDRIDGISGETFAVNLAQPECPGEVYASQITQADKTAIASRYARPEYTENLELMIDCSDTTIHFTENEWADHEPKKLTFSVVGFRDTEDHGFQLNAQYNGKTCAIQFYVQVGDREPVLHKWLVLLAAGAFLPTINNLYAHYASVHIVPVAETFVNVLLASYDNPVGLVDKIAPTTSIDASEGYTITGNEDNAVNISNTSGSTQAVILPTGAEALLEAKTIIFVVSNGSDDLTFTDGVQTVAASAGKQVTCSWDTNAWTVISQDYDDGDGAEVVVQDSGYKTVSLVLDPQGATPPNTAMSVTTGTETQFGWTWAFPELSKKWCRLSSDGLYLTVLERGIYRIEGVVCVTASSTSRVMTMRCVKTVEGITSTIDVTFGGTTSSGSGSNPTIVPICPIEVKTSGGDPGDNNEGYGLKFSFNFNGDVTFGAGTRLIITKTADL